MIKRRSLQGSAATSASRKHKHDGDSSDPSDKRQRRASLTQSACRNCRRKKSKCDGVRPACGRCEKDGVQCVFDVLDGLTRMQNLQQQLHDAEHTCGKLSTLFNVLQRGTDQEATTLLARMRLGDSIEELLSSVATGGQRLIPIDPSQLHRRGTYPMLHNDFNLPLSEGERSRSSLKAKQPEKQSGRSKPFESPVL